MWRTKDGEEIDFLIVKATGEVVLDAKMRVQSVRPAKLPGQFKKLFPEVKQIILVTFGGE